MAGAPDPKAESRMSVAPEGANGNVDPTKNVLDLVRAESKYQDFAREAVATRANDLRAAETRRVDQMANAESRRVDSMLEAETRRQDELRIATTRSDDALRAQRMTFEQRLEAQSNDFQKQIAAVLAAQTAKDALLLSQAVVTTGERLSAIEKNQYLTGGQASVRDPALAETLAGIAATLKTLSTKSSAGEGANSQAEANQKLLFLIVGVVIAGAGIAAGFFH